MAYATADDMVLAFGEAEMVRLSTPEGEDMVGADTDRMGRQLDEASGLMDSYLRRRYQVPIAAVSPELRRCCCTLARYGLTFQGGTDPSEPMRLARKEAIAWLGEIADGKVTLDGAVGVIAGSNSFARVQDRPAMFRSGGRL